MNTSHAPTGTLINSVVPYLLTVETDGSLTVSRYGTTEFISVPVGAWLVFTVTYSI